MEQDLKEIIERSRQGDQPAFRKLVERYRHKAFSLAFRMTGDEEEARDVVQEAFIKIWKKLGIFDMDKNFSTWMYKIVMNSSIDRIRQIKKQRQVSLETVKPYLTNMEDDSGRHLENQEIAALIRWSANGLPEKQKAVFILRELQGLESEEVEQILGIPETSVKSNLYHARQAIRERLRKALE